MPKIIEDVRATILNEAKRQLTLDGYSGMTLRSVASGCGIAVGTIYNYFKSKDELIASFMLGDWTETIAEMQKGCAAAVLPSDVFGCVYRGVVSYSDKYASLFADTAAKRNTDGVFAARHSLLRSQIISLIDGTCRKNAVHYTGFLSEFIAEAILYHASERRDFSELSDVLVPLFKPAR